MKKVYLSFTLCVMTLFLNAQFKWANRGGLWAYDYGYGIVTDNTGNVYVAGKFEFNAIFSDQITVTCQGNHDSYLAKYDKNGAIQWVKTSGGPDGDYTWGLATDGANNLYVAGEIEGGSNIVFTGSNIVLNGHGDNDIFLAKYDMNGNLVWAKNEGTAESEKALACAIDGSGNMYICGYFTDATNFNGNGVTGYGARDIFIAKYDANGTFQWSQKAGGTGRDEAKGIKVDGSGNVYICGMITGNAAFGSINVAQTDQYQDAYVAKLNASDGAFQWVKKGASLYDDVAWGLTLDNAGGIYVTGEFNSYITFEGTNGVPTTKNADVFVAKFDAAGNVSWIRAAGGMQVDRARGIGSNGSTVFLTGQFGGAANFGSTQGLQAADSSDIFLAAIDLNGNWLWSNAAGGPADTFEPLGYESGIAITANNEGVYATGGMLRDTTKGMNVSADFSGIGLLGYTRTDMWVAAVGLNGVGVGENMAFDSPLSVYPNPSSGEVFIDLRNVEGSTDVTVYDMMGQLVLRKTNDTDLRISLDMSHFQEGIYLVDIKNGKNAVQKKVIIQH